MSVQASDRPDLVVQRQIVEAKIRTLRQEGFQFEMDHLAIEAQVPTRKDEEAAKRTMLTSLAQQRDQSYASARRLDAKLAEIDRLMQAGTAAPEQPTE